ncbi:hypothetical protein BH09PSE5_BH09PSE5_40330 [soil metagenome]
MPQDRISVTVLTGAEILARTSARQWRELTYRLGDNPYFMQYEMVTGYLRHLRDVPSGRAEPLAIQLKRNGIVVGILLLERDTVNVAGVRVPALSLVVHPHAPQSDLLLPRDESLATFWPHIVTAMFDRDIRWEVLRFPASRDTSAARREGSLDCLAPRVVARTVGRADYFDCSGEYATLEAKYRPSLRRRLGQASRQLARLGKVEFSCVRGGTPGSAAAFEQFIELEQAGWKGGEGTAIAQSQSLRSHYEQLYALDTAQAWAEVHVLTLDGRAIAVQFCVVSGGIREVVKLAYDETCRKQSPGNVMLDHMLRISCEDARVESFGLVGSPPWLAEWAPSSQEVHDIWLFRHTAIARFAVLSTRLKRSAVQFLRGRLRRSEGGTGPGAPHAPSLTDAPGHEPSPSDAPTSAAVNPSAVETSTPPARQRERRPRKMSVDKTPDDGFFELVSGPMDLDGPHALPG